MQTTEHVIAAMFFYNNDNLHMYQILHSTFRNLANSMPGNFDKESLWTWKWKVTAPMGYITHLIWLDDIGLGNECEHLASFDWSSGVTHNRALFS